MSRVMDISAKCIANIKEKLTRADVLLVVDESEIRDVDSTIPPEKTYLIYQRCSHTAPNENIVCQAVEDALRLMEISLRLRERLFIMISDAASYMRVGKDILISFYPNMAHFTCVAHLLHNCVESEVFFFRCGR